MEKKLILIIEDDRPISQFMARAIEGEGHNCLVAETAAEGRKHFQQHSPNVVLLDLGLPDDDGLNLLTEMKAQDEGIPVIIVSARERENEKVRALDLGADDYVTKPFGIHELMARVRTALRHSAKNAARILSEPVKVYQFNGLVLDTEQHTVKLDGEEVHFTAREFKILELLCEHRGKVLTYSWLMQKIWGDFIPADNQILRVNMVNIRRKLKESSEHPRFIKTELGIGYRMIDEYSGL